MTQTYSQPTVLWKLTRGQDVAKAVFVPHTIKSTLVIFMNRSIDHIEDVKEWDAALERAARTRQTLVTQGWREVA